MGDLGGQKRYSGRGSPQHKHTKSTSLPLSLGKTPETHSTPVSSANAALSVPMLSSPPSLMRSVLCIIPFCCFYLCTGVCLYPSPIPLHGPGQDTLLPSSEVCVHKGLFRRTDPGASWTGLAGHYVVHVAVLSASVWGEAMWSCPY